MTFARLLSALAALTVGQVLAVLAAFSGRPERRDAMAVITARSNTQAAALADVAVASEVQELPRGIGRPDDDLPRLEDAFDAVLEAEEKAIDDELAAQEKEWAAERAKTERVFAAIEKEWAAEDVAERKRAARERAEEAARNRIERIARTETMNAGRGAFTEAIKDRPKIAGWRRRLNDGACQLCVWWARDGETFPPDRGMRSHPNCECTQEAVLEEES